MTTADEPPAPQQTRTQVVRRARKVNRVLATTYPDAHCELDFASPFELLAATILSAQCTDVMVNSVTPALFARYPDARALAEADPADVEQLIKPTGFFRNKTISLLGMARGVVENHDGVVPATLPELVALPGVGRKTANVVLGNAFGVPGITPDTHFIRLSNRLGWVATTDPDKVEAAVGELFPKSEWVQLSHRLIWHGRRRCFARKPACGACPVAAWCPSYGVGVTDPEAAAKLVKG